MPDEVKDDTITDGALEESEDAEAGFGEEAETGEKKEPDPEKKDVKSEKEEPEKKVEPVPEKKPEKEIEPGKEEKKPVGEKKPEEKEEKKEIPESEKTAKDRIADRIKDIPEPEKEAVGLEKEEPGKKEPSDKKEAEPESKLTKEKIASLLGTMEIDDLPDELIIGDKTVNLKEYAKDYGEDFNAILIFAGLIAEEKLKNALDGVATSESVDKQIKELTAKVAAGDFNSAVLRKHSDYYNLLDSNTEEGKGFWEWHDKQDARTQTLSDSEEPRDAILLIDAYKEDIAKEATKAHDDEEAERLQKKKDIHKTTLRGNRDMGDPGSGVDKEDAQAGFNEQANK